MGPQLISSVLSPAMAIVLLLNIITGALASLAAQGSLGPFKLPAALAPYLVPIVAILSGSVTFIGQQAAAPGFAFSPMLVVTALLVGLAHWIFAAGAGQAVEHHQRMAAKARARVSAAVKALSILVLAIGLAATQTACRSKVPSDVQSVEECVVGEVEAGDTNPETLVARCGPQLGKLVLDIVAALFDSPSFVDAHPALAPQLPELRAKVRATRGEMP